VTLIDKYPNLLVVQTTSKSRSLAGMRVGFAFGDAGLIGALELVKNSINSYTLDRVAIAAASAAVRDKDYFDDCCSKIIATRQWTMAELKKLGFSMPDSGSNFIFITHERIPARELFAALRERGILVRYFDKPRIDNYLRVTIGSREEMEEFVKISGEIVRQ
jgi:histidinol-phosphate aminotransferase